jgi:hypothetical protein
MNYHHDLYKVLMSAQNIDAELIFKPLPQGKKKSKK